MKGIFFPEVGRVEYRDPPDPVLEAPTDVLVRVAATSVCGSDLHIVAGHLTADVGFPLGHEWMGEIYEVGDAVVGFRVGDRVVGPAAPYCGSCRMCRRGQIQVCERGGIFGSGAGMGGLGGAQSELIRAPWADACLTLVPDGVSDAAALAVGDILATGWSGVLEAQVGVGDSLVVLGCGPVGLSAIHTARKQTHATRVIAVDTVPERLAAARDLGADETVVSDEGALERIRELTGGGADAIIDAAGANATLQLAFDAARVGGRVVVLGIPARPVEVDFASLLMRNVSLWTGLGRLSTMDALMAGVAEGLLEPEKLFTSERRLAEVPDLYAQMAQGPTGDIKILVRP